MIAGILKEPAGENRVSLLPEQAEALIKQKSAGCCGRGCWQSSIRRRRAYTVKGCGIMSRKVVATGRYDFSLSLLSKEDTDLLKPGTIVLGIF